MRVKSGLYMCVYLLLSTALVASYVSAGPYTQRFRIRQSSGVWANGWINFTKDGTVVGGPFAVMCNSNYTNYSFNVAEKPNDISWHLWVNWPDGGEDWNGVNQPWPAVYRKTHGSAEVVLEDPDYTHKYAILAAPIRESDTDTQKQKFKQEIHEMRLILLANGWTDNNIIFLTRDDISKQAPSEPWIDGDATHENVGKAFDALISGGTYQFRRTNGTLGPTQTFIASDNNSIVFIEYRDHGGRQSDTHSDEADSKEGVICTYEWNDRNWNSTYYWDDTEIKSKINSINCQKLIFIFSCCHSGEFIDDCQGTGRIIIATCKDVETAYTCQYHFYTAITNSNADVDHNGKISIEEAHSYATSQVTKQTPQISDGITGEVYLD